MIFVHGMTHYIIISFVECRKKLIHILLNSKVDPLKKE